MDLISLVLRLEIGIAFTLFSWPISLCVGVAFSIANELAVKYYRTKSNIFTKACTLIIFAFVNTLIIAVGMFFQGKYVMHEGTEHAFVDYENIKAAVFVVMFFLLAIVLWRMLFLGITVLVQHGFSDIWERKKKILLKSNR